MLIRCKTGIKGFDELIQGGLPKGRVVVVCGPPGSGKTLFGIQFLVSGADMGEKGVFVSLNNTSKFILEDMSGFSFGLEKHVQAGKIFFIDFFPKIKYEYIDRFGSRPVEDLQPPTPGALFQAIENLVANENVTRVVIDSIS
jgi:KaiC/GvpD/RAD55 family RecA-like ATPase